MNDKNLNLKIEYVPIDSLRLAPYNPRSHTPLAMDHLDTSIEKYGAVTPLLVNSAPNRLGIIIGGNMRWKVLKKRGEQLVPVIFINIPDEERERELNLRLNANTGDWDYNLLKEFNIDKLLEIGFSEDELAKIWDSALDTEDDNFNIEEGLEKAIETDIQTGDMFQIGEHRALCADSTDPNAIKRLVGDIKVPLVYCDPNYNIGWKYAKKSGTNKDYGGYKTNDNRTKEEYTDFLRKTMNNAFSVSASNAHFFYYCDPNYIGLVQSLFEEIGLKNQRVCLWVKGPSNPTPKVAFNRGYEPAVYATKGSPHLSKDVLDINEILNKEIGYGVRTIEDIVDTFDLWLCRRLATNLYSHATEKPIDLHFKPLRRCTQVGDYVLDMFSGSGSTAMACEQLKRRALVCDHEPIFIQLLINRYEQYTGIKAKKIN